jgi:uncharacterized protein (DUF433 family)
MQMMTHVITTIVSDPDIRGGKPVIAGTSMRVIDVVLTHTTGDKLSAEEIAAHYGLSLGDVHAALAYYFQNQAQMDAEMQQEREDLETLLIALEGQGKLIRFESD